MYAVSEKFLKAAAKPAQVHKLDGRLTHSGWDYQITWHEGDVVAGSFSITNQCTDSTDIKLGSVYVGQMEATFYGMDDLVKRGRWLNSHLFPVFSLELEDGTFESVPLGEYVIKEATHTAEGTHVVAYDNMRKFDKAFKKSALDYVTGAYGFIELICEACKVDLATTEEDLEGCPNIDELLEWYGSTGTGGALEIDTFRDALAWVCQTIGCFATINRAGELEVRPYTQKLTETVTESGRLEGATFSDYITSYTGFTVTDAKTKESIYYGYDAAAIKAQLAATNAKRDELTAEYLKIEESLYKLEEKHEAGQISEDDYKKQKAELKEEEAENIRARDALEKRADWLVNTLEEVGSGADGATMDLGANPFLWSSTPSDAEKLRANILAALDAIQYTPFECSTVLGVYHDLGDVIEFTGGHAGDRSRCCLMGFTYTFAQEYEMQGYGVDPEIAKAKTATAKSATAAGQDAARGSGGGGGGSTVAVKALLTEGVEIATITIDGVATSIFAPEGAKAAYTPYDSAAQLSAYEEVVGP